MICTYDKKDHKIHLIWRGLMHIVETEFDVLVVVKDLINTKNHKVHAKKLIFYLVKSKIGPSEERKYNKTSVYIRSVIWWNQ